MELSSPRAPSGRPCLPTRHLDRCVEVSGAAVGAAGHSAAPAPGPDRPPPCCRLSTEALGTTANRALHPHPGPPPRHTTTPTTRRHPPRVPTCHLNWPDEVFGRGRVETSNTSLNGTGTSCVADPATVIRSVATLKELGVPTRWLSTKSEQLRFPPAPRSTTRDLCRSMPTDFCGSLRGDRAFLWLLLVELSS
jgi:hypothetical protein